DITNYSYSNIDYDSVYNYIRFKPWYSGDIKAGEYFAVEYIGFFKTEADAQAYTYEIDKTLLGLTPAFNARLIEPGDILKLEYTCFPAYADVSSIAYTSSDSSVASVSSDGTVTAVKAGKAVITIKDTATDISADVVIAVQNDTPVYIYGKNSENGENIVLNVIGDSISYGAGVTNKANTYHGRWASALKMTVNNWSVGGSAITGDYKLGGSLIETFVPRMERMVKGTAGSYDVVNTTEKPDILLVYGGTNDYNGNWTIGKITDKTRSTFYGAINELIELSLTNYPEAKIVFFTPIKRCDFGTGEGNDNTGMRRYDLEAYVEAMKEACEYHNVTCIDLYNNEQVNLIGKRIDYIKDGVHMTDAGHGIFAKVALEEMEKAGVIKTYDYTPEPAPTYTLDPERDLSADYHVLDAVMLDELTTYAAGTLLDRQRMSKHTLGNGYIRFGAETLTSKLAPSITVDFAKLDFSVADYPYMSVIYKTDSTGSNIALELRGADNKLSRTGDQPVLVSNKRAAFYVDIKGFASDDINLSGNIINSDLYMPMSFFKDTYSMTAESYVDIESIAFFKTEALASSYAENFGIVTYDITATAIGNGTVSVDNGEAAESVASTVVTGTTITLKATANAGYKLEGWYDITNGKNVLLSRETSFVYTANKDAKIEARFMDETISIAVKLVASTSEGGFISVNGNTEEDVNDYVNGSSTTALTAVADEGYVFAYWKRVSCSTGTEIFMSTDETLKAAPLGNTVYYMPVFVAEGETVSLYLDAQGLIVSDTEEPEVPSRLGYTAGEWKLVTDGDVVDTYKPYYTKAEETNTLTIVYADGESEDIYFRYDDKIDVVGTLDNPIWTLTANGEETIISFSKKFGFGAAFTSNITLTESENPNGNNAIVSGVEAVYDSGAKLIKFVAMFTLPEGATLNERGVLLTNDADIAEDMELNTPNIIVGRVNSDPSTATKTFIINKTKVNAGDIWYGRPYIVYTEGGVTKTLYATTMEGMAK
ncbi:MAG: SGNH/GDSL hydrolase family protein, partial [Clostridia bacterium]|nr:SGNH/GDSL hydrolase family protein [Clostridia bacterium]